MGHYKGSIDLLKLDKAGITEIHGKRCVVIPIEENDIFTPERGGAFLTISYWDNGVADGYGKTHSGQQSYSKAFREAHAGQKPPKLGSLTPFGTTPREANGTPSEPVAEAPKSTPANAPMSDLPF